MKKNVKKTKLPVDNSKWELLKRSKMVFKKGGYNLIQLKLLKP